MQSQFVHMRQQALEWSDKLRSGYLPRHLVSQAFLTTITKSLQYPLPATTLTKSQCNAIMSPLQQQVLPRMGCVCTLPKTLVYAPKQFCGLALPNLYWLQGLDHIDRLVRYGRSTHLTGRLLRHSLEILQLEVGCHESVLSLPYHIFGHLATSTWLSQIWQFVSTHDIKISCGFSGFKPARCGDQCLISLFYSKVIPQSS
jgi:hypothetical protein